MNGEKNKELQIEIYLQRCMDILTNYSSLKKIVIKGSQNKNSSKSRALYVVEAKKIIGDNGKKMNIVDGKDTVFIIEKDDNIRKLKLKNSNFSIDLGNKDEYYIVKNKELNCAYGIEEHKCDDDIYKRTFYMDDGNDAKVAEFLVKNTEIVLIYFKRISKEYNFSIEAKNEILKNMSDEELVEYAEEEMDELEPECIEMDEFNDEDYDDIRDCDDDEKINAEILPDNAEDYEYMPKIFKEIIEINEHNNDGKLELKDDIDYENDEVEYDDFEDYDEDDDEEIDKEGLLYTPEELDLRQRKLNELVITRKNFSKDNARKMSEKILEDEEKELEYEFIEDYLEAANFYATEFIENIEIINKIHDELKQKLECNKDNEDR